MSDVKITTQIADVSDLLDLTDWYGGYGSHFDGAAVLADYVDALDAAAGDSVHVTRSGIVYADVEEAWRAREIDWHELAAQINLSQIAARHDLDLTQAWAE